MRTYIKKLGFSSSIYMFGIFLQNFLGILLFPVYTRVLTPNDLGIIAGSQAIGTFLCAFLVFGLDGVLIRFYHGSSNKDYREYVSIVTYFLILFGPLCALLLEFFGPIFAPFIFKNIPYHPYLSYVTWTATFLIARVLPLNVFRTQDKALKYTIVSMIYFFLPFMLVIFFVVFLKQGVIGKLKAEFISAILILIISAFLIKSFLTLKIEIKKLKECFFFAIPSIPHVFFSWVVLFSDKFFIEKISLAELGIYNIAFTFGSAILMIFSAIHMIWGPLYYSIAEKKDGKYILSRLTTYFIALIIFISMILAVFSREVLIIFTQPAYYRASVILSIISIGYIFRIISMVIYQAIFYVKKTIYLSYITVTSSIIGIFLNWILILKWGMFGAAYAVVLANLLLLILTYFFAQKTYKLNFEYKRIIQCFCVCCLLIIGSIFFNIPNLLVLITIKLLLIGSIPFVLWKINFFSYNEIYFIINYLKKMKGKIHGFSYK